MYYWSFWGMNAIWWAFWIILIVSFFAMATPVSRSRARLYDDPMSILQRRLARGEIDSAEYEERRATLTRDRRPATTATTPESGRGPARPATPARGES
jgi:uncharacterized membrane protein